MIWEEKPTVPFDNFGQKIVLEQNQTLWRHIVRIATSDHLKTDVLSCVLKDLQMPIDIRLCLLCPPSPTYGVKCLQIDGESHFYLWLSK